MTVGDPGSTQPLRPTRRARLRSWVPDTLGVLWVVAAAFAVILPPLVHGASLGPFDLLSHNGLTTTQADIVIHNPTLFDQIQQFIPWSTLAWTQVHHGQLPLWNPYSAFGLPLAFNWASAPFSVPAMLGYLFPVRLAYTVQVVTTLVISGTGMYVLGRVLRLGRLGCVMAATVFELSGPVIGWLGWPQSSVMSWAGWLFAAALLVLRGRHRARDIAFFAVVVACMVYAGYPEGVALLGLALVVFLGVLLAMRIPRHADSRPILRPIADLVVASIAGAALAAPLAFPGLQLAASSRRNVVGGLDTLSPHYLTHLVFQGFDGLPVAGSRLLTPFPYQFTAAYVGVIALVLAVTAAALRRRHPEVLALGAVAVVMVAIVFVPSIASVMRSLPDVGNINWSLALMPMAFAVAVLAGVGMDVLVGSHSKSTLWFWLGTSFAVAGLLLVALWTLGRGHLPPSDASVRAQSFLWPAIQTALGLVVVGVLIIVQRHTHGQRAPAGWLGRDVGRWAGALLLLCETAFLVAAGAPLLSSSSQFLAPSPGVVALQRAVGSSIVGFGLPNNAAYGFPNLGVLPDVNGVFAVHELDVYDAMIPEAYFPGPPPPAFRNASADRFGPAITTVAAARQDGVAFVLEPNGSPGPQGAVFDRTVGDEQLYRIPDAAAATLTPLRPNGTFPARNALGTPVPVSHPDPASWKLVVRTSRPEVLRLRLTDVPGWRGTVDGRPLHLGRFSGTMLQARIPAGRDTIEVTYWPTAFSVGIILAASSGLLLCIGLVLSVLRRRRAASGP